MTADLSNPAVMDHSFWTAGKEPVESIYPSAPQGQAHPSQPQGRLAVPIVAGDISASGSSRAGRSHVPGLGSRRPLTSLLSNEAELLQRGARTPPSPAPSGPGYFPLTARPALHSAGDRIPGVHLVHLLTTATGLGRRSIECRSDVN